MKSGKSKPAPPRRQLSLHSAETHLGGDYTDEEREFLIAMDRLKSKSRFPTCREILALVHELGYRKQNHEPQITQIDAD